MAMDSESDGWLSVSDSFTSDQSDSVGCIHKKIVDGDDVLAEVQPSKLIADCQDCLECKIIRQAIEEFKPGFIDESMTGNHTIEVSWVEKQPGDFESLVKVRLRRCPRKEYRPEDEEYWAEYIPEEDPDLIDQFEIVRKSTIEPFYEDNDKWTRAGKLGQSLDIVKDSSSQDAIDRASKWLAHCIKHDKACEPPDDDFMPTYLIDVGSKSQAPFLFKPSGPRKPYVSLSYCWGPNTEDVLKTTMGNRDRHFDEIPISNAPLAIQDAVKICRGLEIPYLWVDSLCLIQDNLQVWLKDASKMDQIYLNSHLTIAALEPETCKSHFLGEQRFGSPSWQRLVHTDIPIQKDGPLLDIFIRSQCSKPAEGYTRNTLDTRAWCMQESFLPNRRLCFDGNEMIWECMSRKLCECGHTIRRPLTVRYAEQGAGMKLRRLKHKPLLSRPRPFLYVNEEPLFDNGLESEGLEGIELHADSKSSPGNGHPTKMNNLWRRLMSDYSHRGITKQKDRLRAVSGLAKVFADRFRKDRGSLEGVEYLAGLWKHEIHFDLSWTVTDLPSEPDAPTTDKKDEEPQWNVPTWSWASTRGTVEFYSQDTPRQWKYSPELTHVCTIGKVVCQREYLEDETSAVTQGAATLHGALVPVELSFAKNGDGEPEETTTASIAFQSRTKAFVRSKNSKDVRVQLDEPWDPTKENKNGPTDGYYCLRLFAWVAYTGVWDEDGERIMGPDTWFLVLRKSRRVPRAMERIGIGRHESKHGVECPIFEDAEDSSVEIV